MTHPHTEVFSQWNGKKGPECNIQFRTDEYSEWKDSHGPNWILGVEYRVKPSPSSPKLRPWNYEELKAFFLSGACIVDRNGDIHRTTSVKRKGFLVTDTRYLSPAKLLKDFTQVDGSPCGTQERNDKC